MEYSCLQSGRRDLSRRGQVTIFVLVALVIVAGVVVLFLVTDKLSVDEVPGEFAEVYAYYESCIAEQTGLALKVAGVQGGRIDTGAYEPGSSFAPFGNQLDFLGVGVPYWFTVSGNGVVKENVPTLSKVEQEVGEALLSGLAHCDFSRFAAQGFVVEVGSSTAKVSIQPQHVGVEVRSDMRVAREGASARRTDHEVEVQSSLGALYTVAREVYGKQLEQAFLEEYAIDVLRLYAPVDGVKIQCAPEIWESQEVVDELLSGLEANVRALKVKGDWYDVQDKEDEYFVLDYESDVPVRFLTSKTWPSKVEIVGDRVDEFSMVAEPLGAEQGLGAFGFCYVPYHFVYDLLFPVLIQVGEGEELFQFPVVVVIDNNVARNSLFSETVDVDYLGREQPDVCGFRTQDVEVHLFDTQLQSVDGDVGFVCFDQVCDLGSTSGGVLRAKAPACVNGQLRVRAEGYVDQTQAFSSNREQFAEFILDREHEVSLEVLVSGSPVEGDVLVSFVELDLEGEAKVQGRTVSAVLPEVSQIKLSEGFYRVSVQAYGGSEVRLPKSSKTQCQEVARSGLFGFFGGTKEECFTMEIPEMVIDRALRGGGESEVFVFADDLATGRLVLRVDALPLPTSLDQLQENYEAFSLLGVDLGEI
ncbi:hypothetical protein CMI48_02870 [Candidatus Pacearchaeota archaeon]|nr:hypothetical protein [Candidatus Pacearchaeota archaeon]